MRKDLALVLAGALVAPMGPAAAGELSAVPSPGGITTPAFSTAAALPATELNEQSGGFFSLSTAFGFGIAGSVGPVTFGTSFTDTRALALPGRSASSAAVIEVAAGKVTP